MAVKKATRKATIVTTNSAILSREYHSVRKYKQLLDINIKMKCCKTSTHIYGRVVAIDCRTTSLAMLCIYPWYVQLLPPQFGRKTVPGTRYTGNSGCLMCWIDAVMEQRYGRAGSLSGSLFAMARAHSHERTPCSLWRSLAFVPSLCINFAIISESEMEWVATLR